MENIIAGVSKQFDGAILQSKRKHMVDAEVLLKCCAFVHFSDSTKNFSLASQYDSVDILLLVERVDDMKLTNKLFLYKCKKIRTLSELRIIKKVLNIIPCNEVEYFVYQVIKLLYFLYKDSIENNIC